MYNNFEYFKQRLDDTYIQGWTETLENSRASSYKLFSDFCFKKYLKHINIMKFRTALILRVSAHRVSIKTGRWHKPKTNSQK